ncbi:cell division protein ZapA [Romboutsia sp.]|uniref:cell division protein ZapA n=1 Tax=Romboutsia sp. TaxID=1965302 RepID=UPI003F34D0BF
MNKVMVRINGAEYPMVGEKSERHMLSVASYVDKELTKIIESNSKLSSSMAAILAAINIADIFFECSDSNEELMKENEDLKKKVGLSDGESKLEIKKLQLLLQDREKEEANYKTKMEELNKEIESQKSKIIELEKAAQGSNEELENYKSQIEELKKDLSNAEEKANIAEQLTSKFQNDAYKVQLEKIELENEVKALRVKR